MTPLNRIAFFLRIVWRPVTGDPGDTWLQAQRKYPLHAREAWEISCIRFPAKP